MKTPNVNNLPLLFTDDHKKHPTFPRVYFHGDLDDKIGFDLVRIGIPHSIKEGIHDVYLYNHGVKVLYYWIDKSGISHGLVIEPNDVKSAAYAQQCFDEKSESV